MDSLIKSTILKFTATTPQVSLEKIAALLDMKLEILIFTLERMIYTGYIQGTIDNANQMFISTTVQSSHQTEPPRSLPGPTNQYNNGQTEFIKVKTSEVSQEDFIKMEIQLGYLGSHVRFTVKITNKSDFPITEIELTLEFSKPLEVFRVSPKLEYVKHGKGIVALFPLIQEKRSFESTFYLNPDTLGKGKIGGQLKFVNYKDYVRLFKIEDLEYNLTIPEIQPMQIPTELIEQFNESDQMKRDIRSYGLPEKLLPTTAFNHITQIIRSKNFQLLTKVDEEDRKIAWFFGVTEEMH